MVDLFCIIKKTISKLSLRHLISHPILFIVYICACMASFLLIYEADNVKDFWLKFQIICWMWMIIILSMLIESIAENNIKEKIDSTETVTDKSPVKRLKYINDLEDYQFINKEQIKPNDFLLLTVGDIVPADGIVVRGSGYVNEADITGALNPVLKKAKSSFNKVISGSIIESDWLIVRVSSSLRSSFFAKVTQILKDIKRQSSATEMALQKITIGLAVLFIFVVINIAAIANYLKLDIEIIYLGGLVVILLPTSIAGLQHAVASYGTNLLLQKKIFIKDKSVLDNAADVNMVVFDKTGTLTIGQREAIKFIPVCGAENEQLLQSIFLSSFKDDTTEGHSILELAKHILGKEKMQINKRYYEYLPFSASNPISGCNYQNNEIRKGSITAICSYLNINEQDLSKEILEIRENIAAAHGTPLLVTLDKKIIGIIHLQDRLRKNIKKQIDLIKEDGQIVVLITGDNELTASYIAKKLGINICIAEATPQKKLEFISDMQNQGYVIAMYGDGANDALALAQADIGVCFKDSGSKHALEAGNVAVLNHDVLSILGLKNICRKMLVKQGALTIFSVASDIVKYFAIVPVLFKDRFPILSALNVSNLHSLPSAILASTMFSAIIILCLSPIVFKSTNRYISKKLMWQNFLLFGFGGIIAPFLFIKIFDSLIVLLGLI